MPLVSDGAIGYPNHDRETAGLELWIKSGGRGIDTAFDYYNQRQVGWAVGNITCSPPACIGIPRQQIFLTSKIPCVGSADAAVSYIRQDLELLDQSYVDLMLIHFPGKPGETAEWGFGCNSTDPVVMKQQRQATYAGLERALELNLTRSIGVSNFGSSQLAEILETAKVVPAVNQCPMHVGGHDDDTIAFCKHHGISYMAYSPLGGADLGGKSVLSYPELSQIALRHSTAARAWSTAQVALQWILQQGIPVVTSTDNERFVSADLYLEMPGVPRLLLAQDEMELLGNITRLPP